MTRNRSDSVFSSRRAMLQAAGGCAMMTNTSLMATLLNLQATKALMAADTDTSGYKAIVCLFLFGGNDSYNMLVPNDGDAGSGEYGDYHTIRGGYDDGVNNPGGLALPQDSLVPIAGPNGRSFGLHPGLAAQADAAPGADPTTTGVASLYQSGNLALVANIGSLLERTTRPTYQARTNLPLGLFSHSDLQRHWQTGFPQSRSQVTGWGGRMADLLLATNQNPTVSMNISVNGMNLFQTGGSVVPYAIGSGGATVVNGYSPGLTTGNRANRIFTRALDNILDQTYTDLLAKSLADSTRNATDAALAFNTAVDTVTLNTPFADENPSNQLEMVARVIGAQSQLQQQRQIFFVSNGGWDMHGNLISGQETKLPTISRALKSFYDATVELGVQNDVVLFTASDFARTLSTNGQGSDHAWGGNQIILGGGVDGGKIYGEFPDALTANHPLNLGRGRLIPTTAVDELAAELALWFGVSNGQDLETVLPNIRRFYGSGGSGTPLGILG
ncbi:DUF1501 domain-containing protein [Roseiconus nitratireducens]|uniref:DUF1501 domain-containing protein n=1 Tax=Roseiconus nitratireducens TaxID=2605748 RepID=A0A5M6D383_9BACT|nr:DUF1501 domain-containing protein [Roseiconus nitratireducens]KAA5541060.1 DUF1501 domain-containing protein [Roseiconus nitratireducens]